jgi:hypothetical protein
MAKNNPYNFNNKKEFNEAVNKKFKPLINAEVVKLQAAYAKEIEGVKAQATLDASTMLLPMIATSLYEAYGFGQKRIERFVEYFNKHLECISDGVTTADQYEDWCKEKGYDCLIMEAEDGGQ